MELIVTVFSETDRITNDVDIGTSFQYLLNLLTSVVQFGIVPRMFVLRRTINILPGRYFRSCDANSLEMICHFYILSATLHL